MRVRWLILSTGAELFCRHPVRKVLKPKRAGNKPPFLLRERDIGHLVVIGGNGSLRGGYEISKLGINVIGIPATIDNDVPYTASIGFDTAVNTVLEAINRLRDTASSHGRIFVIEVMGRDCGEIALAAGVGGGAESVLIPEIKTDLGQVLDKIKQGIDRGKAHSIIIVAEGVYPAMELRDKIQEETGHETRVSILGHMQRGGTPTAVDRILASCMGKHAIDLIAEGQRNVMVAGEGNKIFTVPLEEVVNGIGSRTWRCLRSPGYFQSKERKHMRKTKIICTIGPASEDKKIMTQLVEQGMNVARLNFSHGEHSEHKKRIDTIRQVATETDQALAIMLDTKGPEIRTGTLKNKKVTLQTGQKFILTTREVPGDEQEVEVSYSKLPLEVKPGTSILLSDGLINLTVQETTPTDIICQVINGGELGEKKGVNVPGVRINMPFLSEKDIADIHFGIDEEMDFIAASFVRTCPGCIGDPAHIGGAGCPNRYNSQN